jgi:hypothetical protein
MSISLKRLGNLLCFLVCGILAYSTIQGSLQTIIHFSGIENEMGFFVISSALSLMFGALTISE